jgi:hypothetical protein
MPCNPIMLTETGQVSGLQVIHTALMHPYDRHRTVRFRNNMC